MQKDTFIIQVCKNVNVKHWTCHAIHYSNIYCSLIELQHGLLFVYIFLFIISLIMYGCGNYSIITYWDEPSMHTYIIWQYNISHRLLCWQNENLENNIFHSIMGIKIILPFLVTLPLLCELYISQLLTFT